MRKGVVKVTDLTNFLKLSLQRALLGRITGNIRCISASLNGEVICINFFYDGKISESDEENASDVETEVIADFNEKFVISSCLKQLNYPNKVIKNDGFLAYLRKE